MRTNLSYRDFKCSRAKGFVADASSLERLAADIPVAMAFWFVLSGILAIDAATAAGVYGFSGVIPCAIFLMFLFLSLLSFIGGSSLWPGDQRSAESVETASQEANLTLNCAFWLVLSGSALGISLILTLVSWPGQPMLLPGSILSAAAYLMSYRAAEGIWSCRSESRQMIEKLREDRRRPVRRSDPSRYKPILQALERAATESTADLNAQQAARAKELVDQLMVQLNASVNGKAKQPDGPVKPEPVAAAVLEFAITDDSSIESALELTVGSLQRLIR